MRHPTSDETDDSNAYGGEAAVERYYRLHARVYDLTRWTFLFGRSDLLLRVASAGTPERILEVGCGTGRNLAELAVRFPRARITGVDLSEAMLAGARRRTASLGDRVDLLRRRYDAPIAMYTYDLVLFSYALTMFNPGFEHAIDAATADLKAGGRVAVVDFHDGAQAWFERWMAYNHVQTKGQLRPLLRERFAPLVDELRPAYWGVGRYLLFVGTVGHPR